MRAFASTQALTRAELLAAPVRCPRPSRLERPLEGPTGKPAEGLRKLEIETVGALLEHLPRERREARSVAELLPGEQATVAVEVQSIAARPVRRRGMRPLVEATVLDGTGAMVAAFFNQPWLVDRYRPGTRLLLHGKAQTRGRFAVASHALGGATGEAGERGEPSAPGEPGGRSKLAGACVQPPARGPDPAPRLVPTLGQTVAHYPAAEGISSTQIMTLVRERRDALIDVTEPLPAAVRVAERLPDRAAALAAMHFPAAPEEAEGARRRLAFEELLLMQLAVLRRRALRGSGAAPALTDARELTARWLEELLPFAPTADQTAAMAAIDADLARARPMQRLLMGEVGSGKTVVALYALLRAVEHGMQGALMAPTETLAEQHFATLQTLVPEALLPTALLTGSTTPRRRADLLGRLATGELKLVVGTHALIESDVVFDRLAVAVVDEQHRFGVRQRAALDRKGPLARACAPARRGTEKMDCTDAPATAWVAGPEEEETPGPTRLAPHVLHMTATPIPRTLALTTYGDLDVTRLRELPKGRRPIATHVASTAAERARAYERIREELRAGRQAYVVCPLVEESDAPLADQSDASGRRSVDQSDASGRRSVDQSDASGRRSVDQSDVSDRRSARAAIAEFERLRAGELRDFRLELLHGQMRPREKQRVMAEFASGAADVLVATTVIEVGIDVPNATVMLVEDAERYGISQLHQLRGRIGRGEHPSVCLLLGPRNARRLRALVEHSDGFELAEIDLELRGEGELAGTRQHGQTEPGVASLPQDAALLERAHAWAERLLAADPALVAPEHAPLGEALERAQGEEAHRPIPA
jgi:ATP-dependent DNA helicase RecG